MRRRGVVVTLLVLPLAFVALLVVEAVIATRREYLPDDPGFLVEAKVNPSQGGPAPGRTVRMVVLGDSTVAGLGARTEEESLAVQIAQRVADGTRQAVSVRGLGVSGARTEDIAAEQLPRLDGDVDVLVIVIGSNDTTHGTPPWRFDDLTREMLQTAREQTGGAPVVLGGVPLFGSATALDQPLRWVVDQYAKPLRRIQRDVAAEVDGVTFTNIAVRASPRFRGVPEAMSGDGFHPAAVGYGFWADALAEDVIAALGPR